GGWDFYGGGHHKNFSPDYLRSACEQSLKRLGTGTIDLYQLHNPSAGTILEGSALGALASLKKEGKIRFLGVSVHTESEALAALEDPRVDAIQVIFNVLDQRMAGKVFSRAREKNVGVIAREPLASGILSGNYAPSHEFPKDDHRRRWLAAKREADWKKVESLKEVLTHKKIKLAQAALEFTLAYPAVSTVIPGAKTRAQALENAESSLHPALDREDIRKLEELYAREEIFREEMNPR
ncbi:MAG TPA: aldo/keto reductase, partial [Candidatus Omnitrophota bacterium]|nr:aldo/keto reductase [Candidatus Omnitrophota bacterium]